LSLNNSEHSVSLQEWPYDSAGVVDKTSSLHRVQKNCANLFLSELR